MGGVRGKTRGASEERASDEREVFFWVGAAPTKDQGPCPAMNEHPRRDTDVILRLPKAPIELFNSR